MAPVLVMFLSISILSVALIFTAVAVQSWVRGFVAGEGLWSKAQRDAVLMLQLYGQTHDRAYLAKFDATLAIPLGDHLARIEMQKPDYDHAVATAGFLTGGNHPDDIPGMIRLFRCCSSISYIRRSVNYWTEGDARIFELQALAAELRAEIESGAPSPERIQEALDRVHAVNQAVQPLEIGFSESLGEAARWVTGVLFLVTGGIIVALVVLGSYISWRILGGVRRSEQAREELLDLYQALVQAQSEVGEGLLIIDAGRVTFANQAIVEMTGYSIDEIKGMPSFMELLHPDEHGRVFANRERRLAGKDFERRFAVGGLCRNGEYIRYEVAIASMSAIANADTPFVVVLRDITERTRADAELHKAKESAEVANLAKSNFLSSMSHELRTPLNAILGFAQLMETGSPSPTTSQKGRIDQILKAGWYLLELINEILDLALIESGKLPLSLEPISLTEVVRECQAMVEPQAQKRDIRMIFPQLEIPYFVKVDRTRVKQVFINLLSNAIKYNKVGGTVDVDYTESTPGRIRICVKDTGEGVTPANLTQLFQPFNRLGKEAGIEEGTGIGLMVSKRLVELMGGEIGVESTVGKGSVFWIELNLTAEPQYVAGAAKPTAVARA